MKDEARNTEQKENSVTNDLIFTHKHMQSPYQHVSMLFLFNIFSCVL